MKNLVGLRRGLAGFAPPFVVGSAVKQRAAPAGAALSRLTWLSGPYHMNFMRTWIWRGRMFCVDTVDGVMVPNSGLVGSVLT